MKDDDALDRAGADKCINPNCEKPNYLWAREQRVNGYCPLCRRRPPVAAENATDAVGAAAPIQNSSAPITPSRVGYSTYSKWALSVSQQYQQAADRFASIGDGGMAAYFLMKKQIHDAEVKEQKNNYRGL